MMFILLFMDLKTFTQFYTLNKPLYYFLARNYDICYWSQGKILFSPRTDLSIDIPRPPRELVTHLIKSAWAPFLRPSPGLVLEFFPPPCTTLSIARDNNPVDEESSFVRSTITHNFDTKSFRVTFAPQKMKENTGKAWTSVDITGTSYVPWGFRYAPTEKIFIFARFDLPFQSYRDPSKKTLLVFTGIDHLWFQVNAVYRSITTPTETTCLQLVFEMTHEGTYKFLAGLLPSEIHDVSNYQWFYRIFNFPIIQDE